MTKILVTGAAGFIGFHLCRRLLERGDEVIGLDNLNNYYTVRLKEDRLSQITDHPQFRFREIDLEDRHEMSRLFSSEQPQVVAHLGAQAGVRYSFQNPYEYVDSNVVGFMNVLEGCRVVEVRHLVYASSSSVYGGNKHIPFSVHDNVDHPLSMYAATKKANELMAHAYAHLHRLPCTGLRFFTVYGPWGRPDMAIFLFTKAILEGKPIELYNHGNMRRDFTYIDDIIEGVVRVLDRPATRIKDWTGLDPDPATSHCPYKIYNIGNNNPVELRRLVEVLETCLGKSALVTLRPMPPGDVPETYADVDDLIRDMGFKPDTPIEVGVAKFIEWYRAYYKV